LVPAAVVPDDAAADDEPLLAVSEEICDDENGVVGDVVMT
jgi:hypothetical protein